jgi:FKBP-type peptidyl-prolyl cis-trans isomerase FklB
VVGLVAEKRGQIDFPYINDYRIQAELFCLYFFGAYPLSISFPLTEQNNIFPYPLNKGRYVLQLRSQPVFLPLKKKIMKSIILSFMMLAGVGLLNAQVPKPVNLLKSNADSVSYVLGEVMGFSMLEKGLGDAKITNSATFMRAINDILGKKKTLMDDGTANTVLNNYMTKVKTEKMKPIIQEGEKFLAKNKLKPGVTTTASGLQYEVIHEGTGIKPTVADTFVCEYRGTLLNGTEFDASKNRNQPLQMALTQVIPGWTEGLQLMAVGSKYKFYIPYTIGYGVMGNGPKIPGGAMLIFEMELLDVKKKQ